MLIFDKFLRVLVFTVLLVAGLFIFPHDKTIGLAFILIVVIEAVLSWVQKKITDGRKQQILDIINSSKTKND